MHIINGNHGPKLSWHRKNHPKCDAFFTYGALNIGGMQEAVKRRRIRDVNKDIYVLTETHLQRHLEHSESHQFTDYYSFWGKNPDDKHFSGVAV